MIRLGVPAGLLLCLVVSSCGGDAGRQGSSAARAGTSVILVSLDTLRADRLSPYGAPGRNSPALARIAAESAVFTDCLAQSSSTGPSHRSLFTGQFVHRHGQFRPMPMHSPYTLAGLLRSAGYETAGFVGGGYLNRLFGFDQGFDVYASQLRPEEQEEGREDEEDGNGGRRGFREALPQAAGWLGVRQAADRSGPFFLFLHTYDIHCPYWPEEPWRSEFGGSVQTDLDLQTLCGRQTFDELINGVRGLSQTEFQYVSDLYDGSVAMTDDLLGEFLEKLRADGVLDHAILIVTSDHGESLGEHAMLGHARMWEEELAVPLMIRFPDGEHAGARCDEPVMLIDLLPTLLDYLGQPIPPGVQGESLLPVLAGEKSWKVTGEPGRSERLRVAEFNERLAVRYDDRWKTIFYKNPRSFLEAGLYDLVEDPRELDNLVETPDGRKRYLQMTRRFVSWREAELAEDRRYMGFPIDEKVDSGLKQELDALGYTGEQDGD